MTKLNRKDRRKELRARAAVPAPIVAEVQPTQEVRHLRCPVCSLQATVEAVEYGPYMPESRIQRYGGSLSSPTGMMRDRPGILFWEPPEELSSDDRELLLNKLRAAIELVTQTI